MIKKPYAMKYPGIRPEDSVNGTKRSGQNAAPIFHDVVAQVKFGKGRFCTWKSRSM